MNHRSNRSASIGAAACVALVWLGAMLLVDPAAAMPAQSTTISLDPDAAVVEGCGSLAVDIRIDDAANLYGADVRLSFDPSLVAVVDQDAGQPGVQLEAGSLLAPPLVTAVNEADNGAGTIQFAATQLYPTSPVTGSGVLATIYFRPVAAGSLDLEFTYTRLGNRDGEVLPATSSDGELTSEGAGCIELEPDPAEIAGCEEIEVAIHIADVANLYGADARLSFDPAILEVIDQDGGEPGVQLEHGDLLSPPLSVARNEADNGAGTIWYAASQLYPTLPVTGSGNLAIIHFRAVGSGNSHLDFTYTKMGNRDGEVIPGDASDSSITATAPASPTIAIDKLTATTARLSWTGVPDIAEYRLYRDPYAYFTPGMTPHHSTGALSYDDVGALGTSAVNHFYVVRSACDNGFESPISNRVGEFDFDLFPGPSPGLRKYDLIGYPLSVPSIPDAHALTGYVGSGVYQAIRYDNPAQGIEFWLPGLMLGTNFPSIVGEPYYLHLDDIAPSLVTFAGDVPALGSVQFALNRPPPLASCRYNYLTVPLDRIDLTDADALAGDIGGVYTAIRYDNDSQTIDFWLPSLSLGLNFPVRVGYPYIVCLNDTAPPSWPPPP